VVKGLEPVLADVQQRLRSHPNEWLKTLQENPAAFANLEKEVHRVFAQMADGILAGLLAQATAPPAFADAAKKK